MAEYTAAALQVVDADQNVVFTEEPVPCSRGWVVHRVGSGVFKLRGITDRCAALYRVLFTANIAVPDGGTAAPISVAVAIDGEPQGSSLAISTPAEDAQFNNVTAPAIVRVPRGCCVNIAVVNTTPTNIPIDVQNANLEITRITG